jgi:hypothetical protein
MVATKLSSIGENSERCSISLLIRIYIFQFIFHLKASASELVAGLHDDKSKQKCMLSLYFRLCFSLCYFSFTAITHRRSRLKS